MKNYKIIRLGDEKPNKGKNFTIPTTWLKKAKELGLETKLGGLIFECPPGKLVVCRLSDGSFAYGRPYSIRWEDDLENFVADIFDWYGHEIRDVPILGTIPTPKEEERPRWSEGLSWEEIQEILQRDEMEE